jgi:hypothetical protein
MMLFLRPRIAPVILALALALEACACRGPARSHAFLVITFDVEDCITPETERVDDIPKWPAGPPPRPRHVPDHRIHEAPPLDAQAGPSPLIRKAGFIENGTFV